jgi:AcrR family transcriptional regulator
MIDENECSTLTAMAGVKQFDRDEVLDRAMAAFWTRSYEATSIDDLVERPA